MPTIEDRNEEAHDDREPYEPPAVISEEVFETLAQSCQKVGGFGCAPFNNS